jgi:hypothetical protein
MGLTEEVRLLYCDNQNLSSIEREVFSMRHTLNRIIFGEALERRKKKGIILYSLILLYSLLSR